MLPFFLLVAASLLFLFRLLSDGSGFLSLHCDPGSEKYRVLPGNTCWSIAETHGGEMDTFLGLNPEINCKKLPVGIDVCVPTEF